MAIVREVGGARAGVASVTAETAPHGPPSHSAIMAAQASNAIPTGPRITQAVSFMPPKHRIAPSTGIGNRRMSVSTDMPPEVTSVPPLARHHDLVKPLGVGIPLLLPQRRRPIPHAGLDRVEVTELTVVAT